jgi:hypothetical protein
MTMKGAIMLRAPIVVVSLALLAASLNPTGAQAAVNFTVTQTSPVAGSALFNMGSTSAVTFRITNTSTAGETITIVRFRVSTGICGGAPCTGSVFSTATATPAGWTRAYSTGTLTFTASTAADRIPVGGTKDFTITFTMGRMTVDYVQSLRDVRATFSTGARSTTNNPGSWTLYSLNVSSLQTTDCAGGAVTSIGAGADFCVDMTVRNNSSTAQNGVISNPNPIDSLPANVSKTGTVTQGWISTSPAAGLNLASNASGIITYRYSTSADDTGTIQFVAIAAQRSAAVTSRPANSNILVVDPLSIAIAIAGPTAGAPTCIFSGETATFTTTITNISANTIFSITPSALSPCTLCTPSTLPACDPPVCTATFGAFSAPTPASIASLAPGASAAFTWTAPLTETVLDDNYKPPFWVRGNLTYTATTTTPTTYYVRALPATNVGANGTTNLTVLNDYTVSDGSSNQYRALMDTTAPTGTSQARINLGGDRNFTNQEFFRSYTPVFAAATTLAANATAYADFYMRGRDAAGTVTAKATLYEYNAATGIVGAAKGTASFVGNAGSNVRQAMNNVSFGNAAFTVTAGNRLLVVWAFDMTLTRPAYLWGQASGTSSGHQSITIRRVGTGPVTSPTVTSANADIDGYVVKLTPAATNATSRNEELTWSVINKGCAPVQQLSLSGSIPAGWTWTGGDSYSLVGDSEYENWSVGGANPPVVFAAPAPAAQLPLLQAGDFKLVFPATPAWTGIPVTYTFDVTITDANATPLVKTLTTTITVNAFDPSPGGGNYSTPSFWREKY